MNREQRCSFIAWIPALVGYSAAMKMAFYLIPLVGLLAVGCGRKNPPQPTAAAASPATNTNATAVGQNPLMAPVDYLGVLNKAQKTAVNVVDTASLKKSVDLFYANEGRFPKDLNELVTKQYYAQLPAPPYGKKFQYDPQSGQISIVNQ